MGKLKLVTMCLFWVCFLIWVTALMGESLYCTVVLEQKASTGGEGRDGASKFELTLD